MTLRRVSAHSGVDSDVSEALSYYAEIDPELKVKFAGEYIECLAFIEDHPEASRALFDAYRRVVLPSFPYLVAYKVTDDEIRILAVLHAKRDPALMRAQLEGRVAG